MKDLTNSSLPIRSLAKSKLEHKENLLDELTDLDSLKIGNIEYTKRVIKALRDVLKDNEDLRNKIKDLESENEFLKNEIKENYDVIEELGNVYEYCKENHTQREELFQENPAKANDDNVLTDN